MDYKTLKSRLEANEARVCVVGLGYVGLPLALGFAKSGLRVLGFDVIPQKIEELKSGKDPTREVSEQELAEINAGGRIEFTTDESKIKECDFVIICVPTPIKEGSAPDLKYIESAGASAGKNLKENSIIVLESTVYPGVTEEVLGPILEKESGLKHQEGFCLGYSPERINPGDKEHTLDKIAKVVSGCSQEAAEILGSLYSRVAKEVHLAENIKTAEAAKVIENIQRDLNIALMNELAMIFERIGIDVHDVLRAAGTKWNFHKYYPGLVGGHCIPVDPYYLVHKARELGYDPKVILAGREINNCMPHYVASLALKGLEKAGRKPEESRVLLLGLTFKKNVRDIRNTPAKSIIGSLKGKVREITAYDPVMLQGDGDFGIPIAESLEGLETDCIILATDHDEFKSLDFETLKRISGQSPVLVDARGFFSQEEAEKAGFIYLRV